MKKDTLYIFLCSLIFSIIGCTPGLILPKIDRQPEPANWNRGRMPLVPTYDPNSTDIWQMDLRSYDLSNLDLRQSLNDLMYADFDTQTVWPTSDKMPPGFDWQTIMELGKNPGLGVRGLQAKGINGRNVGIAIIDQPMIIDHQEYAKRIKLYEEINIKPNATSEMHGPAVASIAVGKTTGVAPEADLYYIATYPGDWGTGDSNTFTYNFQYIAQGINRIIAINQKLPGLQKIRAISISVGWGPDIKGYDEVTKAVNNAKEAGIFVISSNLEETYGYKFQGLGRSPLADPDKFENLEPGIYWTKDFFEGSQFTDQLLVPMDSRTTAGLSGTNEYVFYRQGGRSWAIPYIAGVYALAAQVKPTITPDEFWQVAMKTGKTIQLKKDDQLIPFGPIIDPVKLIASLQGD